MPRKSVYPAPRRGPRDNMNTTAVRRWYSLMAFKFDPIEGEEQFRYRLARHCDWTMEEAKRAIAEYRSFLFLIAHDELIAPPSHLLQSVRDWHVEDTLAAWPVFDPPGVRLTEHERRAIASEARRKVAARGRKFSRANSEEIAELLEKHRHFFGEPREPYWTLPKEPVLGFVSSPHPFLRTGSR